MPTKQIRVAAPPKRGNAPAPPAAMPDHCARGIAYARDVVAGRIDVCKWVTLACKRHLDDLERWDGKPSASYRFDRAKGNKVCRFIEMLPHTKGPKGSTPILLENWQCWLLTSVFGWVHNGGHRDGKRRFRRAYLEMPRGQGKSALSSGVALFMLAADGEPGAECYSLGTTRDQARIVFRDAQQMARKTPDLMRALGVDIGAHNIRVERSASRFEALAAEAHGLDGLSVHFACLDELHAHRERALYDVVETATGKRDQSLLWAITTAGTDLSGICYEVRGYLTKVLQGVVQDDSQFGVIYSIDEDRHDWQTEAAWRAANPNFGVSVMPDVIGQLATKAMQLPSAQNNFRTKHLCVWCNSDSAWLAPEAWNACADTSLSLDDFAGQECFIAMDLATKTDIAAKVYLFPREQDGVMHYYLFGRYYLPEAAISDGRNASYAGWEIQGRLVSTPGEVTDFGLIEEELLADAERFRVVDIAFDPWQEAQIQQRLMANGAAVVTFRPTVQNFSPAMKEIAALVLQRRIHHDGCPVLTWMVSNTVCHTDAKDNIYPRKETRANKIDGVVASIMAMGRAMAAQETADAIGDMLSNPIRLSF